MSVSIDFRKFVSPGGEGSAVAWNLQPTWNGASYMSATKVSPEYKDFFKREWIEEDGVDVYVPGARTVKECEDTIELILQGPTATVKSNFNTISSTLNGYGVFEYRDDFNNVVKRLVLKKIDIVLHDTRAGMTTIQFKLVCLNVLGKDTIYTP